MNVKKKDDKDNIKEFKDLFEMGKNIKTTSGPSRGIDLTYNPGQP